MERKEKSNITQFGNEGQKADLPEGLVENLEEKQEEHGFLTLSDIESVISTIPKHKQNDKQALMIDIIDYLEKEEIELVGQKESGLNDRGEFQLDDYLPDIPDSANVDNSLDLYFIETGNVPLLTKEEEVELAKRIERGRKAGEKLAEKGLSGNEKEEAKREIADAMEAREHFALANTRLVASIAKKYTDRGLDLKDLIQEGNLGLLRAIGKFDYTRGYRFSTYATWWIRQSVTRALTEQGKTIRIPVHASDTMYQISKAVNKLRQELGRDPDISEISERIEEKEDKVEFLMRQHQPTSLDKDVGQSDDGSTTELAAFIEDEDSPNPEEISTHNALKEVLAEVIEDLPVRQAQILRLRFGFSDREPLTLEEVASKFNVTRERIRQIEGIAIRLIRKHPRAGELAEFLD